MALADDRMQQGVDRFLKTGKSGEVPAGELAAACDRRVRAATESSNRVALALGQRFVDRARPHGGILYLTALRAHGWATLVAGRYTEAEQHYLEARKLARRDPLVRGRIDRVLIDVYMYLGNPGEAQRRARRALATFKRLGAGADTAKTHVNYANVLHRQDRHLEAGKLYRSAAEFFADAKVEVAAALCYYNLANTRVQLFDFEEAEALYTRAREIYVRHEDRLHATGCLYGIAWLHMLTGDFHKALRELSECEEAFRLGEQARELVLCQLDRAESYLALNLFIDARQAAEAAARIARKLGLRYEAAKAALFAGRAAVGLGRKSDARKVLRAAREGFAQEHNRGFVAASDLSLAQTARDPGQRRQLLAAARKNFTKVQLPLWQAICDLHLLSDAPDDRAAVQRLARSPAVRTVPHLFAGWHTLRGDQAAKRNRWRTARQHWSQAADVLDAVRAKLPPVEMRSAYLSKQADPFGRLVTAEYARQPLRAAAWSERYKTGGIWSAPAELLAATAQRQKIEADLADLAGRVAAYSGLVSPSSGRRGLGVAKTSKAQARLQTTLRNRLAELEVAPGSAPQSTEQIEALLHAESFRQPIVQFHVGRQDLFAFVHDRGSCHTHRYVDGARRLDEQVALWRFLVECTAYSTGEPPVARLSDEEDLLCRMGRWLLPPLELPSDVDRLLVLPEGQLVSLPWLALRTNGSCIADRYDVALAPSLRHHLHACKLATPAQQIHILVGDRTGLDHIDHEIEALRARLQSGHTQVHDPCRRDDWPDAGESRVWHFSGHASLRADNPFYSALRLADGPLFAADFRLRRHRVGLVTLAACRTGQHTSLPGDESMGLVRSLLEMGAKNVVASHWAVADLSTALWMDELYKHYLGGASVSRAVRRAAQKVRESHPSVYHWGAFSAFGSG